MQNSLTVNYGFIYQLIRYRINGIAGGCGCQVVEGEERIKVTRSTAFVLTKAQLLVDFLHKRMALVFTNIDPDVIGIILIRGFVNRHGGDWRGLYRQVCDCHSPSRNRSSWGL